MPEDTYALLVEELNHIFHIGAVCGLLGWDEQVNLPPGSKDVRAQQNATMAALYHQAATHPKIGEWLGSLESDLSRLNADQKVVVKEAAKSYRRMTQLPEAFVKRRAAAQSRAYHAWTHARETNQFAAYAPFIQEQIELAREEAHYVGEGDAPYDYCIDKHEPGMRAATIETLFNALKAELIPIVDTITQASIKPDFEIFKNFSIDRQETFLKQVIRDMGFDFNHGRIDRSVHPFCAGIGPDIRMTTRFDENNPIDSLSSSIHETGHGLYEQGLPRDALGTALAEPVGMAVHESQSRLWENQVGRGRAFWNYYEPMYRQAFPEQLNNISANALFLAVNGVRRHPIRVDSDEVTYNLHIIVRFEIEKQLFTQTLDVHDLPEAWNALSKSIIGIEPHNDSEGVLQDVHWSGGAFGYFPSYCLGNMLAAQLWYAALAAIPDLESQFAHGNFASLLSWLRTNIHQHGKRYDTLTLTERVTGQPLSHHALIRYLQERYLPLYT